MELIHRLRTEPLHLRDVARSGVERRRALKRLASRLELLRPWARFAYLYLFRMGFLDGPRWLDFLLAAIEP